ncbi:hypothetical protein LSTR_LSTR007402 [Laodelphax striatellus]|uniref:Uncharacterized protein n=1 Tax=Laodelphax striatellus TaxID=195883 RepID=A0A482XMV6_LAOST|nr:hypothetical protein LSTR_LSTR007402 [Laodelphax striatellus]
MNHLICLPDGKWPMILSCGALVLTVGSLIAISVSLETAYMWLLLVLVATLFLTTFTCSPRRTQIVETEPVEVPGAQPFWIVDLPPTYAHVIGSATPPPSYANIHHLPPKYEELKIDLKDPNLASTDLYRYTLSHQLDNFHLPQRSSINRASLASVHST